MQGGGDAVNRAPALDESLARAHQLAVAQSHGAVSLEHLLFALTEDADAVAILGASRISVDQLRTDVSGHLGRVSETVAADPGQSPRPGADLLRILQLAGMAARQSQRRMMDGGIVLAAIIGDGNSPAAGLLKAHGLTFEDVIRVLQTAGAPRPAEIAAPTPRVDPAPSHDAPRLSNGDDALAMARSRVRQSEPTALKPFVPRPPPVPAPVLPLLPATVHSAVAPLAPPAVPMPPPATDARERAAAPPTPRMQSGSLDSGPSQAADHVTRLEAPRSDQSRRDNGGPPPVPRIDTARVDAAEPMRARAAGMSAEPITVPVTQPATEQAPLARLRQNGPQSGYQGSQQTGYVDQSSGQANGNPNGHGPPPQRPPNQPYQPRPVPSVAPRSQSPYPIAQAPGPRTQLPQRADLPPLPPPPMAPPPQLPPPYALLPSEPLEIVQAASGLPAVVRRDVPVLVEIRIPRSQVDVPRHNLQAAAHGATILRAVTTRLTSGPVSGLSIEPRTPETAWLGPAETDSRDVIWQYVLLPTRAGTFAVTLSVTGRTLSPGGVHNDASTAAETFAVRVKPERGRFWRRLFGTMLLLGIGGGVGWALTGPLAGLAKALLDVVRG